MSSAKSTTQRLADFVADARFCDLKDEVVDYTKMIILDSLICGITAASMERSRMIQGVVRRQGGTPEASVFGINGQYPAPLAVMANAEMMNALDADDTFFSSSHFAAVNVAAALAEAQRDQASGEDMILATAVGFDISARLNLASQVFVEDCDGTVRWSKVMGMGFSAFGTAATAARIRGFDSVKMRNLFGLLESFAPTPSVNKVVEATGMRSLKMANYPAVAHAAMLALEFADAGYVANQDCLDGDGFLLAQGCLAADEGLLVEDLGQKWWILETAVKYYPSCRYTHGAIDLLFTLMKEESLTPEMIERIEVGMNPMALAHRLFRDPTRSITLDHCAPFSAQFNIPYVLALAALGIPRGPRWYAEDTLANPTVWALAKRIHTVEDPLAMEEVKKSRESRIKRFRKSPASITVWANGRRYERRSDYVSGDPWAAHTRVTWDALERKLAAFGEGILSGRQQTELIHKVQSLESLRRVDSVLRNMS